MNFFDRYISAIWGKYGLRGVLIAVTVTVALLLIVLVVAALVLGIDVGTFVNQWLGVG